MPCEIGEAITKGYPIGIHPPIAKRVNHDRRRAKICSSILMRVREVHRRTALVEIISATSVNTTAMSMYRLLDHEMIAIFEPFRPHYNIPDLNNPYGISNATKEQPNQAVTIANWLYGGHDVYNYG